MARLKKEACCLLAVIAIGMLMGRPADAAGLLIAEGGFGGILEIKEQNVHVTINNGIAATNNQRVGRFIRRVP